MMKLMQIIILSCKKATFYSSIKNFKKLKLINRLQLKLHLILCKDCYEFDHQSQIIDQSLVDFHKNYKLQSEESLSKEKIIQIKSVVNQQIN